MRFNGTASAAPFTKGVPIDTPTTWESGGSGSHTDDLTFNGSSCSNLLMNAATTQGPGVRTLGNYVQAMLADIGCSIVPEPGSAVLRLAGAVAVFLFHQRRRKPGCS